MFIQGRLVWMKVQGRGGKWKSRPVVVVTSDNEIPHEFVLVGVACSHSAALIAPRPAEYVELPYDPVRPCVTKLNKKTVAICTWLTRIAKASDTPYKFGGFVPPAKLKEIIALINRRDGQV